MFVQLLTSRLRLLRPGVFAHWCPACMTGHVLAINSLQADGKRLGFDGDLQAPTFEPFIEQVDPNGRVCRYLIRGGRVSFSPDCTHSFAGKTIELPFFPLA